MQFCDLKAQYAALEPSIGARMQRVLEHGQYIMGPEVGELEGRLAAFTGVRHCIGVASGTEALLIALMALGIGRGDEVITTPFSFAATAEVIVLLGATPVFVDVEADTALIDARLIEAAITPATRAILPVSLYGQMADMAAIDAIASRHGLAVIEDAAQSFGATYRGRRSGGLSYGSTYSGPIGSVITPHLQGLEEFKHLSYASSLCGNCTEVCSVKINLHELLLENRSEAVESGLVPFSEKMAWKLWRIASLKRGLMNLGNGNIKNKVVNGMFKGWKERRSDLQFSQKTFNQLWKERYKN